MTINNISDLYLGHGYTRGANTYPDVSYKAFKIFSTN